MNIELLALGTYDGAAPFGPIDIADDAEMVYIAADRQQLLDPDEHVELMLYVSLDGGAWLPHGKCGTNGGPAFQRDRVTPLHEFGMQISLPPGTNRKLKGLLVSMQPVTTRVVLAAGDTQSIMAGHLLDD